MYYCTSSSSEYFSRHYIIPFHFRYFRLISFTVATVKENTKNRGDKKTSYYAFLCRKEKLSVWRLLNAAQSFNSCNLPIKVGEQLWLVGQLSSKPPTAYGRQAQIATLVICRFASLLSNAHFYIVTITSSPCATLQPHKQQHSTLL